MPAVASSTIDPFAASTGGAIGEFDPVPSGSFGGPARGCNITVPFKFEAAALAQSLSERAQLAQAHYAAAKAGVMALTRCAAIDAAEHDIRINAVAPGAIKTDLIEQQTGPAPTYTAPPRDIADDSGTATAQAPRRAGIGGDGLLRIVRNDPSSTESPRWFMDYRNADGSVGSRNILAITTTVPCVSGVVERPRAVTVRFLNDQGEVEDRDFVGLWATSVQHQIDHLDGRLYVDRLSSLRRKMLVARSAKLAR